MNTPKFPDNHVTSFIETLSNTLDLRIEALEYTPNEKLSELLKQGGDDEWTWVLVKPNTNIQMKISFFYPSYLSSIVFWNNAPGCDVWSSIFNLDEYLSKYLKNKQDADLLHKVVADRSWKQNWKIQFEVLERYWDKLSKVVEGKEWPIIKLSLDDYFEPEALDRMYEDTVKKIDSESQKKNGKGWLSFINVGKKK